MEVHEHGLIKQIIEREYRDCIGSQGISDAPSAIYCACHPFHWVTAQYIALGASYYANLVSSVFYAIHF